jgi:hypothetical protein
MRRLFAVFALVTLAACGGDKSTGPPDASVPGTWTLTRYNGSPVPYTATTADTKTELLSGSLVFTAPNSYALALTFRYTESGVSSTETQSSAGTYAANGSTLTLQSQAGGPPSTGTISGTTLSINGDAFVFVKS